MRYIIAPKARLAAMRCDTARAAVIDGLALVNENELRHPNPGRGLAELVAEADGTEVSRTEAAEWAARRMTAAQILAARAGSGENTDNTDNSENAENNDNPENNANT